MTDHNHLYSRSIETDQRYRRCEICGELEKAITKSRLMWMIDQHGANFIIGRALLAIYNQQTQSEQNSTHTHFENGRGFSKPDARVGSIGARMFKAHGTISEWMEKHWLKPTKARGNFPRICKYAAQLNDIANEKAKPEQPMNRSGALAFLNEQSDETNDFPHY